MIILLYLGIGAAVVALGLWGLRFLGRKDLENDPRRQEEALVRSAGDESLITLYAQAENAAERAEIAGFARAVLAKREAASEPELLPLADEAAGTRENADTAGETAEHDALAAAQLAYAQAEPETRAHTRQAQPDVFADRSALFARQANAAVAAVFAESGIALSGLPEAPPAAKGQAAPQAEPEIAPEPEEAAPQAAQQDGEPSLGASILDMLLRRETAATDGPDAAAEAAEPAAKAEIKTEITAEADAPAAAPVAAAEAGSGPDAETEREPIAETAPPACGKIYYDVFATRDHFDGSSMRVSAESPLGEPVNAPAAAPVQEPEPVQPLQAPGPAATPVSEPEAPAEAAAPCPHCGAALEPGCKFCITCGMPVQTEPAPMPEAIPAPTPVVTPDAAPAPEFMPIPEPIPEQTPAPEVVPILEAVPVPDVVPVPEAVPAPEIVPAPEVAPVPEAVPAPEIAPVPEAVPTPEIVPVPEAVPAPEVVPVPEIVPAPEAVPVPEVVPVPEAVPAPEVVPVPEIVPVPEVVPVPEAVPAPEVVPVPEIVSVPEAVPAPETVPVPEPAREAPPCLYCGAALEPGCKFCITCGMPVPVTPAASAPEAGFAAADRAAAAVAAASADFEAEAARVAEDIASLKQTAGFWQRDMSREAAALDAQRAAAPKPPRPEPEPEPEPEPAPGAAAPENIPAYGSAADDILASVRELERRIMAEVDLDLEELRRGREKI